MSLLTFPKGATQLPLENLTRAGHRQRIGANIDAVRALVPRDPLLAERNEIGHVDGRARLYDDDCMDRFTPTCVRNADDRTLQDPGILRDDILHFNTYTIAYFRVIG